MRRLGDASSLGLPCPPAASLGSIASVRRERGPGSISPSERLLGLLGNREHQFVASATRLHLWRSEPFKTRISENKLGEPVQFEGAKPPLLIAAPGLPRVERADEERPVAGQQLVRGQQQPVAVVDGSHEALQGNGLDQDSLNREGGASIVVPCSILTTQTSFRKRVIAVCMRPHSREEPRGVILEHEPSWIRAALLAPLAAASGLSGLGDDAQMGS